MLTLKFFNIIVGSWIILALIMFPILLRVIAPYGRYASANWGPLIDNRLGWIFMELPSLLIFVILFLTGNVSKEISSWVFMGVWVVHYTNRIFIFPLRIRTQKKKMPLLIMGLGIIFNLINAFLNGYWLGYLSSPYLNVWLTDPRFIIGFTAFIAGFIINQASDNHLINLRSGMKTGYFIPQAGMFRYVSCPNFLGEIIEWTGFAVMTWSVPGLSFAIWTAANLIPRALHHHKWYGSNLKDYPEGRKAIIPGIL